MQDEFLENMPGYLTSKEAGVRYGATNDYIGRLCRQGKLKGRLIGRTWYVQEESLLTLMQERDLLKEENWEKLSQARQKEYKEYLENTFQKRNSAEQTIRVEKNDGDIESVNISTALQQQHVSAFIKSPVTVFFEKSIVAVLAGTFVVGGYGALVSGYPKDALNEVRAIVADVRNGSAAGTASILDAIPPELLAGLTESSRSLVRSYQGLTQGGSGFFDTPIGSDGLVLRKATTRLGGEFASIFGLAETEQVAENVVVEVPEEPIITTDTEESIETPVSGGQQATTIIQNITQPVVERVIATVGLSEQEFASRLDIVKNNLLSEIYKYSAAADRASSGNFNAIALSQRIDELASATISSSDFTNGTIQNTTITGSSFSGSAITAADLTASGTLTISGTLTNSSTATSTFAGKLLLTHAPTLSHTFGAWMSGVSGTNYQDAALIINPTSAAADSNLLALAVNGSPRFLVDAEGDVFVNSITATGGITLATTTASTFSVENNTTLGDSLSDTTTINGTLIVTGTTTASTVAGNFGVGTTSPYRRLSVSGDAVIEDNILASTFTATSTTATSTFPNLSATNFSLGGITSFLGHALTTVNGALSVSTSSLAATFFQNGGNSFGTTTRLGAVDNYPLALLTNNTERLRITETGNVGIGTTTPDAPFTIQSTLSSAQGPVANFTSAGSTFLKFFRISGTSSASLQAGSDLILQPTSGNVGIGTNSPGASFLDSSGNQVTAKLLDIQPGTAIAGGIVVGSSGRASAGTAYRQGYFLRRSDSWNTDRTGLWKGSDTVASSAEYWEKLVLNNDGGDPTIHFSQNNVPKMTISSNGSVGIGTTTPLTALSNAGVPIVDLAGVAVGAAGISWATPANVGFSGYVAGIRNPGSGAGNRNGLLVQTAATDSNSFPLRVESGLGVPVAVFNAAGSVGIGDASPDHKLDVDGNIGLTAAGYINWGDTTGSTGYGLRDSGGTLEFKNSGGSWQALPTSGSSSAGGWTDNGSVVNLTTGTDLVGLGTSTPAALFAIQATAGNNAFVVGSTTATSFIVDLNGNVGVGTAVPSGKLEVSGQLSLTGTNSQAVNAAGLNVWGGTNGGTVYARGNNSGGDDHLTLSAVNDIIFNPGLSTSVTFKSGGSIGIGTTTPNAKLAVIRDASIANDNTATLSLANATTPTKQLVAGYDGTYDVSYIQSTHQGVGSKNLALNPVGGGVGIGTTTPGGILSVANSSGFEQFRVSNTASAVNYWNFTGNTTGNNPYMQVAGVDTNVGINFVTKGTGAFNVYTGGTGGVGSQQLSVSHTANSVNYLQVTGSAASNAYGPYIMSTGSDANVPLAFATKGTQSIGFFTNGAPGTGNAQFAVTHTASAVNYLNITGGTSGQGSVFLYPDGSGSAVSITSYAKGAGNHYFGTSGNGSGNFQFVVTHTASANRYIQVTGSNGGTPTLSTSAGNLTIAPSGGVTVLNAYAGTITSSPVLLIPAPDEASNPGIAIRQSNNAAYGFNLSLDQDVNGSFYLQSVNNNTPTTRLVVERDTGNVGVGTTSPWARLSVDASAGQSSFAIGSSTRTTFEIDSLGRASLGTSSASAYFDTGVGGLSVQGTGDGNKFGLAPLMVTRQSATAANNSYLMSTTGGTLSNLIRGTVAVFRSVDTSTPAEAGSKVLIDASGATTNVFSGASLTLRSSGGTFASTTSLVSGAPLGAINFTGTQASGDLGLLANARIQALAAENWGTSAQGTHLLFGVTATSSASLVTRAILSSAGNLGVGAGITTSVLPDAGIHISSGSTTGNNLRLGRTSSNEYGEIDYNNSGTTVFTIKNAYGSGSENALINFDTAQGTALTIKENRNVGVGTTSPYVKFAILNTSASVHGLELSGAPGADSGMFRSSNSGAPTFYREFGRNNVTGAFEVRRAQGGAATTDFVIDTSGNVGIGTTTPASRLTIQQATLNEAGGLKIIGSQGLDSLYIYGSSDNVSTIDAKINAGQTAGPLMINPTGGQVAVGSNGLGASSAKLLVGDGASLTNYQGAHLGVVLPTGSGSWLELSENSTNGTAFRISKDSTTGVVLNTNGKDLAFKADAFGTAVSGAQMILDTTGRLNIGGTSYAHSSAKLQVRPSTNQNFVVRGPISLGSGVSIQSLQDDQATDAPLEIYTGGAAFHVRAGTIGLGGTSGAERLKIDSSGNVGVGTTAPGSQFANTATNSTDSASIGVGTRGILWTQAEAGYTSVIYNTGTGGGNNQNGLLAKVSNTNAAISVFTANANGTDVFSVKGNGNVGIGTTTPGAKLNIHNGALCVDDATPTCQNASRTAGTIYAVATAITGIDLAERYPTKDATLGAGEIVAFDTANEVFVTRAHSATTTFLGVVSTAPGIELGGYNDDLYNGEHKVPIALAGRVPVRVNTEGGNIAVGDAITLSSLPGIGKKATTSGQTIGTALEAASGTSTIEVFIKPEFTFIDTQLFIDTSGNLGLGTTTPEYKLHVLGDVAAQSFVNISTRDSKKNINYLTDAEEADLLQKLLNTQLATYQYLNEQDGATEHLGLIAEEAPAELLTVGGKGVDIYKFVTALLAAVKSLAERLATLEANVAAIQSQIAGQGAGAITAVTATFDRLFAGEAQIDKLCVGGTCVTETELALLLTQNGIQALTPTPLDGTSTSTPQSDTEAPTIILNGSNPAIISVGASYLDLGALVTDNVDSNLGYDVYVNDVLQNNPNSFTLDTATSTTYTLLYTAVDMAGNIGSTTRMVVVE